MNALFALSSGTQKGRGCGSISLAGLVVPEARDNNEVFGIKKHLASFFKKHRIGLARSLLEGPFVEGSTENTITFQYAG